MRNFRFLILGFVVFGVFFGIGEVRAQVEETLSCECDIFVTVSYKEYLQTEKTCTASVDLAFFIENNKTGINSMIYRNISSDLGLNMPSEVNLGGDLTSVVDQMVPVCLKKIQNDGVGLEFLSYPSAFLTHKFESKHDCDIGLVDVNVRPSGTNSGYSGKKGIACGLHKIFTPITPTATPTKDEKETPFKVPSAQSLNKLGTDIPSLIGRVIKTVMGFVGTLALVIFIYAGILWMTAHGNSERQKKAMDTLVWASIGILVILSSYALVNFIFQAFK